VGMDKFKWISRKREHVREVCSEHNETLDALVHTFQFFLKKWFVE
jgi:hypothetical protein